MIRRSVLPGFFITNLSANNNLKLQNYNNDNCVHEKLLYDGVTVMRNPLLY